LKGLILILTPHNARPSDLLMPNRAVKPALRLSLILGLSTLLGACNESNLPETTRITTVQQATETDKPLMPLPTVIIQPEADSAFYAHAGIHIESEAARRYGNPTFLQWVEEVNGKKLKSFKQGDKVYFPTLLHAFQQAKLDPAYLPAIQALSEAHTQFYQQLPAYLQARPRDNKASTITLPPAVQQGLQTSQRLVQQSIQLLQQPKAKHRVPKQALQQLEALHNELDSLSAGKIDGYGYDYNMAQQHFGYAFSYLLQWTKQGYR
jgi:hypothetical protein